MRSQHGGKDLARQIANAVFIPLGIALNFAPGIGGSEVGKITRAHESLLAAAGWTFSIWSLIFVGQLAYALWQLLPAQRSSPVLRRIGWLTAANGLLQGLWTVAFCEEAITLSWVMMLTLLVGLVLVEVRLRNDARRGRARWLVRVPLALNLGWISVATILDTSLFLHDVVGWRGAPLSALAWCEVLVVLAALLAVAMAVLRRNLGFGVAVAWGLVGIAAYRSADTPALAHLAYALAGLLAALLVTEGIGLQLRWTSMERLTRSAT